MKRKRRNALTFQTNTLGIWVLMEVNSFMVNGSTARK